MRVCDVVGCKERAEPLLVMPEYHNVEDDLCPVHRRGAEA